MDFIQLLQTKAEEINKNNTDLNASFEIKTLNNEYLFVAKINELEILTIKSDKLTELYDSVLTGASEVLLNYILGVYVSVNDYKTANSEVEQDIQMKVEQDGDGPIPYIMDEIDPSKLNIVDGDDCVSEL